MILQSFKRTRLWPSDCQTALRSDLWSALDPEAFRNFDRTASSSAIAPQRLGSLIPRKLF
jgi:hypothetical protein